MKLQCDNSIRLLKILSGTYIVIILLALTVPDLKACQNHDDPDKSVNIGLLIPDNKSMSARNGAEMAIRKANENGGFNGRLFRLVVRSTEGPWGTGSGEAANLIFEDKVWAILGSDDGRNAHLVEQVIAKTHMVFLSARASDPTLSKAFVPWFFNCVPNDLQQADALIDEIYNKRKINKIAVVSDDGYDSKMASESFLKKTELSGKTSPAKFFYENSARDFSVLIDQIKKADIDCIILFGQSSASKKIIQQIRQSKMSQPVFGSLSVFGEDELSDPEFKSYEGIILVSSGYWTRSQGLTFRQEYQKIYGKMPCEVAAFAYDGMNLIIEAIRKAGSDSDKIQKSLAKIHYEGVTGPIQFDDKGNRKGIPGLMEMKNGIPVLVERQ
jgi:branched-chain amino acid transport system substrate-binding protein